MHYTYVNIYIHTHIHVCMYIHIYMNPEGMDKRHAH